MSEYDFSKEEFTCRSDPVLLADKIEVDAAQCETKYMIPDERSNVFIADTLVEKGGVHVIVVDAFIVLQTMLLMLLLFSEANQADIFKSR